MAAGPLVGFPLIRVQEVLAQIEHELWTHDQRGEQVEPIRRE